MAKREEVGKRFVWLRRPSNRSARHARAPLADVQQATHHLGMAEFESLDGDDDWDQAFADDLIGCTLLVGLTFVDHADALVRRQQVFGTVECADKGAGITLRKHSDGERFTIAPVLDAIQPGEPGIYRMSDSDEEIEDPDFTALITVRAPYRS